MDIVFRDFQKAQSEIVEILELANQEIGEVNKFSVTTQYAFLATLDFFEILKEFAGDPKLKRFIESHGMAKQVRESASEIFKKEAEAEFSTVNNNEIVLLYSYLEANIKRLVITIIKNCDLSTVEKLGTIKVSLSEYLNFKDDDERYEYLFTQFEKEVAKGTMYGIDRFEKLLGPFSLSGTIDKRISKIIFELAQLRNNLLHKGGVVDAHLIKHCPWLNLKLKEKIKITNDQSLKYYAGAFGYILTLIYRMHPESSENNDDFKNKLGEIFKDVVVENPPRSLGTKP